MTLKGTHDSTPACSACKFRRRKCSATCPLAPYFPADKPEMFGYVHRLYGVSHITKILESLETKNERDDAMRSIIFESQMRDLIPVYGCTFVIESLTSRLAAAEYELSCKRALIAALKSLSDETVDHNSPSSQQEVQMFDFLNEYGGIHAELMPENVAGPVPGLDLSSDVTSNHSLFSTDLDAQTSASAGIQREPQTFFVQDFGAADDDGRSHACTLNIERHASCQVQNQHRSIDDEVDQ